MEKEESAADPTGAEASMKLVHSQFGVELVVVVELR